MMRHYVQTGYGKARDQVRLVEAPTPVAAAGELLIAVEAAALNPVDFKILRGDLRAVLKMALPAPMGLDGCGTVIACGAGVSDYAPGDAVMFCMPRDHRGSFGERVCLYAKLVAPRPAGLSHGEAASLPLVALTTVQALVDRGGARAGQSVLIHAGSGGVGSFAVQYAKALGLRVVATTSSRNAEFVASLGADRVIAYDREDYRQCGESFDLVYDTLGGAVTYYSIALLKRGGSLVSIAGPPTAAFADQLGVGRLVRMIMALMRRKVEAAARRQGVAYHFFFLEPDGAQLAAVGALVAAGRIRPVIDSVHEFDALDAALDRQQSGRARGKVILRVGDADAR